MARRCVIAGAGVAGLAAAETLRQLDPEVSITIAGSEEPYSRMVLPYFMAGRIEERALFTGDDAWFREQAIETRFGEALAGLDPQARTVRLAGGDSLDYDALVLATGSGPVRAPIPGADAEGCIDLWNLEDARAFLAGPHREVAIIGAGFIASTILDAVLKRAERVHLLEIEPQILPRMIDAQGAALIETHLRGGGVDLHTGTEVKAIERAGARLNVSLSSGDGLAVDVVIFATGIRPNLSFLAGSGIETDAGILVDRQLRTNVGGVWAAGDVAQGPMLHHAERRVHAIQPTAVDHGRVAAADIAGVEVGYEGSLLMNVVAIQGIEAASFGLWEEGEREATRVENAHGGVYRKYVWEGDVLVGGVLVGPTHGLSGLNDAGMLKGLIQTGAALGPWRRYLEENPLDLRRAFVASGAAQKLLGSTLLTGRAAAGGGFRFRRLKPRRARSPHHATLVKGAP
jgi:NAD(P)H-nitrite reductase large subunit